MARDSLEERLDKIFDNLNGWLKFAEAKNAALLTLNAAGIFGVQRIAQIHEPVSTYAFYWVSGISILLFLSLIICLASFSARTKVPDALLPPHLTTKVHNLIFFGHLAELDGDQLLLDLSSSIGRAEKYDRHHEDIAQQIVVNAKITMKKYALFNLALWVTIGALITPIGAVLLYWLACDEAI